MYMKEWLQLERIIVCIDEWRSESVTPFSLNDRQLISHFRFVNQQLFK